jgi:hypothetical protein
MFLISTSTNLNNKKFVCCNVKIVHCRWRLRHVRCTKFQGDMSFCSKENRFEKANGRVYLFGHTVSPVFPYEISTTGKNNISNSLPSHLGSSFLRWWFFWIMSLICGSFSDSIFSCISGGTIFIIWRGSGRKRPSHNLSFSVSVFVGSNWG